MSAMDKVRGAREVEALEGRIAALSAQVEAMAERLAELDDEAHAFLAGLEESSERRAQDWNEALEAAAATWEETVARRIEPLAQSMAALSDEGRRAVAEVERSSQHQAATWLAAQDAVATRQKAVAQEWRQAAGELRAASIEARSAARGWHGYLWVWVAFAAAAPIGVLLIGSMLWLPQGWTLQESPTGSRWLQVTPASEAVRALEAERSGTEQP